jgi:anti-sigma B factor antagonist
VLEGEHDVGSSTELADTLARALESSMHLIVDVSGAAFVDSTVIHIIVDAKSQADTSGRRFNLLVGTAPIVDKALEVTGVLPALNTVHSLDEALAGSR